MRVPVGACPEMAENKQFSLPGVRTARQREKTKMGKVAGVM